MNQLKLTRHVALFFFENVHIKLWMCVKFWNWSWKSKNSILSIYFFCTMKTWNSVIFVAFSMKFYKNFKFYFFHTWNNNYWSTMFFIIFDKCANKCIVTEIDSLLVPIWVKNVFKKILQPCRLWKWLEGFQWKLLHGHQW